MPSKRPAWEDMLLAPEIRAACQDWTEYRKQMKLKPWVPMTWERALAKWGNSFPEVVDHAISQGWQGLHPIATPPSREAAKPKGRVIPESDNELPEWRRRLRDELAQEYNSNGLPPPSRNGRLSR